MFSPEWMLIVNEFESDGALREIVVPEATLDDWDRVIDELRLEGFRLEFKVGGNTCELPAYASETFTAGTDKECYLQVTFSDIVVIGSLDSPNVIRFVIVPHAIHDWAHFESLVNFMRLLANATESDAIFTPENRWDNVIFLVHPGELPVEYIIDHG